MVFFRNQLNMRFATQRFRRHTLKAEIGIGDVENHDSNGVCWNRQRLFGHTRQTLY